MEPCSSGTQKRKVEHVDDETVCMSSSATCSKRKCIDISVTTLENHDNANQGLMCLPDDVLYIILSHLHPKDRLEISLTCRRMLHLVNAPSVWRHADCRPLHVNNSMFEKLIKFLSVGTHSLSIRGYSLKHLHADIEPTCTPQLLQEIKQKCTKIKVLRIEEDLIHEIRMKDFPSTLEELSLAGSANRYFQSENSIPYFFRIDKLLLNLTTLCLRQCRWFEPHALMFLSKLPNLRNLDVSKCTRLGECVPYFSLAMRHGFKKLQVLDLRDTLLGDSEISCLKSLPCLTDLLLECPTDYHNENSNDNIHVERNPVVLIRPFDRFYNRGYRAPRLNGEEMRQRILANMARDLDDPFIQPNPEPNEENNAQEENEEEINHYPQQRQIIIHINRPMIHVVDQNNERQQEPVQPEQDEENPAGRAAVEVHPVVVHNFVLGVNNGAVHMPHLPTQCLISDRAICGFGNSDVNNELNLIRIQGEHAAEEFEPLLERIVLRNYTLITDRSLRHLTNATPRLKYLDVCGTKVTQDGVEKFKHDRPDCNIISDFNC